MSNTMKLFISKNIMNPIMDLNNKLIKDQKRNFKIYNFLMSITPAVKIKQNVRVDHNNEFPKAGQFF